MNVYDNEVNELYLRSETNFILKGHELYDKFNNLAQLMISFTHMLNIILDGPFSIKCGELNLGFDF